LARHRHGPSTGVDTFGDTPTFNPVVLLAFVSVVASVLLIYLAGSSGRRATPAPSPLGLPGIVGALRGPSPSTSTVVPAPSASSSAPPSVPPSPVRTIARPRTAAPPRVTTPPPRPAPVTVTANYSVRTDWGEGFVADIIVRNAGAAPATWIVQLTFTYDVTISSTNTWNASVQRLGATYHFGATWALDPGESVQFGFVASKSRTSSVPSRCLVDGHACS